MPKHVSDDSDNQESTMIRTKVTRRTVTSQSKTSHRISTTEVVTTGEISRAQVEHLNAITAAQLASLELDTMGKSSTFKLFTSAMSALERVYQGENVVNISHAGGEMEDLEKATGEELMSGWRRRKQRDKQTHRDQLQHPFKHIWNRLQKMEGTEQKVKI
ncbi:hypothetical protein L218DRAFT_1046153 [Marasmius fiardii PR-910]|nr:hypothetical protein L218DRAFT_1046153 [Marasmius fiardii PR-910]